MSRESNENILVNKISNEINNIKDSCSLQLIHCNSNSLVTGCKDCVQLNEDSDNLLRANNPSAHGTELFQSKQSNDYLQPINNSSASNREHLHENQSTERFQRFQPFDCQLTYGKACLDTIPNHHCFPPTYDNTAQVASDNRELSGYHDNAVITD